MRRAYLVLGVCLAALTGGPGAGQAQTTGTWCIDGVGAPCFTGAWSFSPSADQPLGFSAYDVWLTGSWSLPSDFASLVRFGFFIPLAGGGGLTELFYSTDSDVTGDAFTSSSPDAVSLFDRFVYTSNGLTAGSGLGLSFDYVAVDGSEVVGRCGTASYADCGSASVPEPGVVTLLATGLAGLFGVGLGRRIRA